ncbi:probable plastidic glucose transporter 2 isoform X1 [Tanacetum coccineum]
MAINNLFFHMQDGDDRHGAVFIGSALLALQEIFGINVVFYVSSTVFKSVGSSMDIANMSVGVANLSVYISPRYTMLFISDLEDFYVDLWMKCERESILDVLLL